ncbi:MAG: hypothetical protein GY854_14940 [Deltaproteobacteria bacterium]|nr:hypothetical protein [Deltaproteobacteria bacterium]
MAYAIVSDFGINRDEAVLGSVVSRHSKRAEALRAFEKYIDSWDLAFELSKSEGRGLFQLFAEDSLPQAFLAHGPRKAFRVGQFVRKRNCHRWFDRGHKEYRGGLLKHDER